MKIALLENEERPAESRSPGLIPGSAAPPMLESQACRLEWRIAALVGFVLLLLRGRYAISQGWNSDEPQHLHVVWGWTQGLVPYRDFFDNHTPLFHLLYAPLFAWLGERPDIVTPMRLAMLPLFALSLWCVYRLAATAFSQRAGLWAAVLVAVIPKFFVRMGEFRTDVMWAALWLLGLMIATGGPLTRRRLFWAGLVCGAAFSVSMKTVVLLIITLAAAAPTWLVWRHFARRADAPALPRMEVLARVGAALGGVLVVPGLFLTYFAARGALGPLYYCVIEHNTLPGTGALTSVLKRFHSGRPLLFLVALALGATTLPLFASDRSRAARRLFLILVAALFYPVLHTVWPVITPQDDLPWYPLIFVAGIPTVLFVGDWAHSRWGRRAPRLALPLLLLAAESVWLLHGHTLRGGANRASIETIAQALKLTDPGEYIMDPKGAMIFRPRPYYYVLETLTRKRVQLNLITDDLPERLTETRTPVVLESSRMSPRSLRFIAQNYVPSQNLLVLGKILPPPVNGMTRFEITIPERYTVANAAGPIAGSLDGTPLTGPRWLEAGLHELLIAGTGGETAVMWSRVIERGFPPFPTRRIPAPPED